MSILVLTPSFKRVGSVLGAFLFAKYVHEHGHGVVFASLDPNQSASSSVLADVQKAGLAFHSFDMDRWTGLRHLARVRNYVRDNGVDVVLSYGLRPDIVNSCLSRVVRLGAIREILRDQYALTYGPVLSRLGAELHLATLKKLDGVFVLTQDMRAHLAENGIDPSVIHLVNNFVDVSEIRKHVTDGDIRENSYIHVGYFGRLVRRKRVDVALRGVCKLVYEYACKNVKFHIAGDGPLRGELTRLADELGLSEQTVFYGDLANPLELMKRMNLVILTSDREGMPRCLLEALSLGKTCIATDIPGMSELIRDGDTGYLFRQGDCDGLASLLNEIIRSDRYVSAEHLYRFMITRYDVNACAKEMLNCVHEVSRSKTGRSF